ncbi:MAG: helix-turn-helix transcriptional regulator [Oscillospiraceae bacterium]|nr:helix-turn-helix transcriptional regulator [Oscillospiraceae bacterium]
MTGERRERYRENYRRLGLKIAYYRKLRGYTQEQFAELIGKSWSFLSQIEANNGKTVKGVSLETLFQISDALTVPISKLFEE